MRFHWASLSQFFSISPILRRWRRLVRLLQLQSGRKKTRKFEPLGKDCHQVRTTGCRNSTSGGRNPKFWSGLFKRVSNQMQPGAHTHTHTFWMIWMQMIPRTTNYNPTQLAWRSFRIGEVRPWNMHLDSNHARCSTISQASGQEPKCSIFCWKLHSTKSDKVGTNKDPYVHL